jgi:hypothetical protein
MMDILALNHDWINFHLFFFASIVSLFPSWLITGLGFRNPKPFQASAIPKVLKSQHVKWCF